MEHRRVSHEKRQNALKQWKSLKDDDEKGWKGFTQKEMNSQSTIRQNTRCFNNKISVGLQSLALTLFSFQLSVTK